MSFTCFLAILRLDFFFFAVHFLQLLSTDFSVMRGFQIKADRGETEHADKDIEQLQKETAKKANESARAK